MKWLWMINGEILLILLGQVIKSCDITWIHCSHSYFSAANSWQTKVIYNFTRLWGSQKHFYYSQTGLWKWPLFWSQWIISCALAVVPKHSSWAAHWRNEKKAFCPSNIHFAYSQSDTDCFLSFKGQVLTYEMDTLCLHTSTWFHLQLGHIWKHSR